MCVPCDLQETLDQLERPLGVHRFQSINHECIDQSFKELLTIHSKSVTMWVQTNGRIRLYLAGSLHCLPPQLGKRRIRTGSVDAAFTIPLVQSEYRVEFRKKKWCSRPKPVNSRKPSACTECEAGMEVDKIANCTSEINLKPGLHVKKICVLHIKRLPL